MNINHFFQLAMLSLILLIQSMPFLLNRKWTLPEKKNQEKQTNHVSWKSPQKPNSFWSIPENQKQGEEESKEPTQTKISHTLRSFSLLTVNLFQELELSPKVLENYYTIDLLDKHQKVLPKVKSIPKAEKLLLNNTQFQYFKKLNSRDNIYYSALSQIEKIEESYLHKLNISSKAQIKTRKNIYELQNRNRTTSVTGKCPEDASSVGSNKMLQAMKPQPQPKKRSSSESKLSLRLRNLRQKNADKWKLKDFWDPIVCLAQNDQSKIKKLRQRQKIVQRLSSISTNCQRAQREQTGHYFRLFGRFSEAVQTRLVKKHRKLVKIQQVFNKDSTII